MTSVRLPLVLAGPQLRRCDAQGVCVWLATSQPLDLRLAVHEVAAAGSRAPTVSAELPVGSGSTAARLGRSLWAQLVWATPAQGRFPTGKILAYDLFEPGGDKRRLRDLVAIADVVVDPMPLPTLVLQPDGHRLHMLFSSCRKLHGDGDDAMLAAETVLRTGAADPGARLNAILLGGDQIYADDVADLLARPISELASELIGRLEEVPGLPLPNTIPVRGRSPLVRGAARLTSTEAGNHLITFGEFAAMYLLAWNPECWPARLPNAVEAWNAMPNGSKPAVNVWLREAERQRESLERARRGSAAIRRLLANVPTYMTFDDHEITDDWNLNPKWTKDVLGTPAGARILLNGMAAYWAFQAWGNTPDEFTEGFRGPVQRYCETGHGDREAWSAISGFRRWAFKAPTSPPLITLDTRTGRDRTGAFVDRSELIASPRDTGAARLLDATERRRGRELGRGRRGAPLIVVAPTPIFGFELIELGQGWKGRGDPAATDLESWHANPISFVDVAKLLLDTAPTPAVVLSGDLHYGFEASARLEANGTKVPVIQLTSSATKNEVEGVFQRQAARAAGALQIALSTQRRWWWPGGDDDGDTWVARTLPGWAATAAATGRRADLAETTTYGNVMESVFSSWADRLLLTSNVGELWVDGQSVRHRFWIQDGGRARPLATREWKPGSWPF